MKKTIKLGVGFRSLLVAVAAAWLYANTAQATNHADYLAQWLQQPTLVFGETIVETNALRDFYAARNNEPVWVDSDGLTSRAKKVFAIIEQADKQGLNSELYAIDTMRTIASMPRENSESALRRRLSLEVLMSYAVMEYAGDMQVGATRPQWNTGKQKLTAADQIALLNQVAAAKDKAAFLIALAPTGAQYKALKNELQRYQTIASKGGWPEFTTGKSIKPGMSDPRVTTLRTILVATGDLKTTKSEKPALYDDATQEAVKRFQERHGIEADGTIGTTTQTALAVPVNDRIAQLAMTLERMRWMPSDLGSRYVLVNVPGYTLTAVAGGKNISMNVIVGKPNSKTPMFSKNITDVVINPSWGVPAKIAVNEMLPKVRNNPSYLTNAGYTVTDHSTGSVVNPNDIDWESVDRGSFTYSFRQSPGDGNALGKVKFTIPESDNIYLHDTSQRGLFVKADRSLSHGCVRLGDPKALTEFVLNQEGWTSEKINAAYDSSAPKTVAIAPLPVHLVYWTSWVDGQGRIHFSRDIYGMDKKLMVAMGMPTKGTENIKLAMN